jgi:hypothetical protein
MAAIEPIGGRRRAALTGANVDHPALARGSIDPPPSDDQVLVQGAGRAVGPALQQAVGHYSDRAAPARDPT